MPTLPVAGCSASLGMVLQCLCFAGGGGGVAVPVLSAVAVAVTVTAQACDSCAHRPAGPSSVLAVHHWRCSDSGPCLRVGPALFANATWIGDVARLTRNQGWRQKEWLGPGHASGLCDLALWSRVSGVHSLLAGFHPVLHNSLTHNAGRCVPWA